MGTKSRVEHFGGLGAGVADPLILQISLYFNCTTRSLVAILTELAGIMCFYFGHDDTFILVK